ncbi:Polyketide synthase HetM [Cytospora mali]|uniref:Polyketide synthase HetM n=1 Tax=Cytospora mali TaxID=578113 RepID=A0A194UP84_CYTMA|nr:Polyketide synthase HetM [Valsa mali var. pyri (nom. inval.)]
MANEHEKVARWQDDLLPYVVDRLARNKPDTEYAEWVTGSSVVAINHAQLANLFVTSPRNSPAAHRALFDHLKCRTFITTDPIPPPARAILDSVEPLRHLTVPSVEELLGKDHPLYVLSKKYQDLQTDPFVFMHTSGTTGLPKPTTWTHKTCNQVLDSKSREMPDGIPSVEGSLVNGKRVIVKLPPFHSPKLLGYCATHLETILYIGGDLPQDLGDRVAARAYLRCLWGAPETGIGPQLLPPEVLRSSSSGRDVWRYIRFHPCVGAVFDKVTDDVFLNGEKTNPISMEQYIMARNTKLSGALVIGAQRFQAALLIETASERPLSTAEQAALIEHIWPSVEEANRNAPAHARVEKAFIVVLPADRRLIRAGKGTFMRGPSISQYTEEIEKLYGNADVVLDDNNDGTDEAALQVSGLDGITRLVRQHVRAVTGWSSINGTDNLFDQGMDSLSSRVPYGLAAAIFTGRSDGLDERKVMGTLLATCRGLVQQIPAPKDPETQFRRTSKPVKVLLTGSTGTVGTYLLRALLDRVRIGHIFCLGRHVDGGWAVQKRNFTTAGLKMTELDDKSRVTFINADFQQPLLELDSPKYESLRSEVGLIIHAAWAVNFNITLAAFRPHLAGMVNLLSLAALSVAQFVFISSVAAVGGYTTGPPPEEVLNTLDTSGSIGCGRSKLIGELLVDATAQHLGDTMPATIIRIGQVAGPVQHGGLWNPHEWLPSMVLSSLHLGQIPDNLGPLFDNADLVPVDLLADVLVDLATAITEQAASGASVFNLRNPRITPWRTLLPAVTNAYADKQLQVVPPTAWLAKLRASNEEEGDDIVGIKNPALKLLDFFGACDRLQMQVRAPNYQLPAFCLRLSSTTPTPVASPRRSNVDLCDQPTPGLLRPSTLSSVVELLDFAPE